MKDDQLDDLKQFIDSRISQSEALMDEKLKGLGQELREEMQDGFTGVGEAIEQIHTQMDATNAKTDQRLTNLEQAAA